MLEGTSRDSWLGRLVTLAIIPSKKVASSGVCQSDRRTGDGKKEYNSRAKLDKMIQQWSQMS